MINSFVLEVGLKIGLNPISQLKRKAMRKIWPILFDILPI